MGKVDQIPYAKVPSVHGPYTSYKPSEQESDVLFQLMCDLCM